MAGPAFLLVVLLGLGMTFFADEWAFLADRSLTDPATWLPPHNEHWVTLPMLAYRLLVETVGIGSYVPFLLAVAIVHVAVAALVYRLLAHSSGPIVAVAGAFIVLLFGSGFENLFWGFQLGFVGALAFGLAALLVIDRGPTLRRGLAVAALLMLALMSTGIGIVVATAVGIEWLIDRRWRRYVPILLVPAVLYLAWLVAFGRAAVTARRDPLSTAALSDVPAFVADGIGNALSAVTGLPQVVAAVAVAAIVGIAVRRRRPERSQLARVAGLAVAIVLMYGLTAVVRAQTLIGAADYPRYTYISGVLTLVLVGTAIGPVTIPAPGRERRLLVAGLAGWITAATILNVSLLVYGRATFLIRADTTRALVRVALAEDRPNTVDLDRSLVLVPAPAVLERIAADYGDPRTDALVPWAVRPIPTSVQAAAEERLLHGAPTPPPVATP
jgi:hypothetical protein